MVPIRITLAPQTHRAALVDLLNRGAGRQTSRQQVRVGSRAWTPPPGALHLTARSGRAASSGGWRQASVAGAWAPAPSAAPAASALARVAQLAPAAPVAHLARAARLAQAGLVGLARGARADRIPSGWVAISVSRAPGRERARPEPVVPDRWGSPSSSWPS